ncbi:polymorphic toxin-type HINT domain-containing protein [Ruminococcus sp.]|uniref:polymorphic toxin-type HINT domain-containing protein n=1 Tax=Ruminococcus sp. TaxID=41978 RepID=UPI001B655190|nr:polymorphic toxin-type HINT domain-containing protein [Ruminococcus sp.]MBP5433034.1 hypothetical protein [Ruminococcus sp.]
MKNKKLFNKIIASALSVVMGIQYTTSVLPQSVYAAYIDEDYVLYSSDDTVINTENAVINGSVYTGDKFDYRGSSVCYVNELLNANEKSGSVTPVKSEYSRSDMPDYSYKLSKGVSYDVVYDGDETLLNASHDLSSSIFAKGALRISNTVFSGKGYIKADGDVIYDAVQNADGCEIFICSENGNVVIQGTDLTIDGIIYAPNGKVEINAKHLKINGAVIAKNTEINGTDVEIGKMADPYSPLLEKGPELRISGSGDTYRENRKITLDISESLEKNELIPDSVEWSFKAENPAQQTAVKIDDETSTTAVKNLVITEAGNYRIEVDAKTKKGDSVKYYDVLTINKDIAPVSGFWIENETTERDGSGEAVFRLEDTSYSLDGDKIGSRIWSVFFDSDNDGDFSDEKEEVFSLGNETNVTYKASSVGKYRFRLQAAEYFEDTIPKLISKDAYLSADSADNEKVSSKTEVINNAPVSNSGISKAKNVDIVVTVGTADTDDIRTINNNVESIKKELEDRGFSVNLSTVSTSTLTAKDQFAWTPYDHYDYQDNCGAVNMEKHIFREKDSIKMIGYGWAPLRDWLFVDDGVQAKRVLSFDMIRDKTDWHSMEGGGFLFNTSIREEKVIPEGSEEEVTVKKMSGYCILLCNGAFRLVQLNDINADEFRDGGISNSVTGAGKLLVSVPVSDSYDNYSVKIITSDRTVSVYANNEPKIENFVLPDKKSGTGFGPIICHGSHGCSQQSYFTFSNIRMTTVSGSELSDILDNYKWRDSAERFVVNLSKESNHDLQDETFLGAVIKSLTEKDLNLIGLGTVSSQEQYKELFRSVDGTFIDWYDLLKEPETLKKCIMDKLSENDYSIKDDTITTSDEIDYNDYFVDKENDPVGEQSWKYTLDASVYENSKGESGEFTEKAPITVFTSTGKYSISSILKDDPTKGNENLKDYSKWSNATDWTDCLYVHSKPVAEISSEIAASDSPDKMICSLSFSAYDPDAESKANKGIKEEKFQWKCIKDQNWTDGRIPRVIDADKVYLQKYAVCDEMGQWSDPCVEVVYAEKQENIDQFRDDMPPKVTLNVSDPNPYRGDTVLVSAAATDDNEVASVVVKANGRVISNYQGSVLYTCSSSGEVTFTVECKDIGGNEASAEETITVQGPRDTTPPTISINHNRDVKYDDGKVTVSGTIKDETKFGEYKVSYAVKDSEDFKEVFSSDSEIENGEIVSFDLPDKDPGEYTIIIEAVDAEGNKRFDNIALTITEEKVKTDGSQTTEKKVQPKRENIPSEITLESSAEIAEIGETVIVKVDAVDEDGLVSLITYVNNKKVGDGLGELRICEIEPKTVTVKAVAQDSLGARTEKSIEIVFQDTSDHTPPVAEITVPGNDKAISGKVIIKGSAFDETALRKYQLDYKKSGSNTYSPIVSSMQSKQDEELGEWDTYALDNGVYELRLTVTDNGGNSAECKCEYQVQNGALKPEEPENNGEGGSDDNGGEDEQLIFFSKPEPNVTADKVLKIEAQTDSRLINSAYSVYIQKNTRDSKQIKAASGVIGSDCNISASVDTSILDEGNYTVTIAVSGRDIGTSAKTGAVIKHGFKQTDSEEYKCAIVSPADLDQLTGVSEIKAEITSDVFTRYKFEYATAGTGSFVIFDDGKIVDEKELTAEFDTTLITNGYYDIRVTVYNDEITVSDTVTADVDGSMKIGNFTISFTDIETSFSGLPVSVIRTYDSRTKDILGDFGYGWDMAYNSAKISVSGVQGENWETRIEREGFFTRYDIKETRTHRIKVDLGNGIKDEFAVCVNPASQMFVPLTYGVGVEYVALNGSRSKLQSYDMRNSDLIHIDNVLATDDGEVFDPHRFLYTRADGTKYVLDTREGIISATSATGETLNFSRDAITASDGKAISFTRDKEGRITEISTAADQSVKYTYDAYGDLVSVADLNGNTTRFVYRDHYITEMHDPRNVCIAKNEYDSEGRLVSVTDSYGNVTKYEHDIDGREEIITDRNGGVTKYVYDERGNVTAATDPMGNTVKKSYDSNGRMISKTSASGHTSTYKYNENGDVESMTDSEGNTVSSKYNQKGMLSSVNAMGTDIMTISYDDSGLVTKTVDALGNSTDYSYNYNGRLTSVSDGIGEYMNIVYDNDGNVISTVNGAGDTADFTYDEKGNCISKTVKYKVNGEEKTFVENYTYDEAGNVLQISDNAGRVTSSEYNVIGKVSATVDEKGRRTRYDYDNEGNLTRITYADGTTEQFTYDKEGNNLTATDRLNRTVTMEYDKVGNLLSKTYPNGTSESYTYDKDYNLISKKAVNGAETKYEYDSIGRNTAITDTYGNRTEFVYNSNSQLREMKDPKGYVYSYTYDANGNKTDITYPDGTSSHTDYDARGRVTSQTDQNGNTTSYKYDGADRLTGVTDALGNTTSYAYDEAGELISVTDAEGNITQYGYDEHSRVNKIVNAAGQTAEMTYDSTGNVLTSTDFGGKKTEYSYDGYDRLVSKKNDSGRTSYSYTRDGKLASASMGRGNYTFTYDAMDNLTKLAYPDGSYVEYAYDDFGRMTSMGTPYGTTAYTYDDLDRIVRITDKNGAVVSYRYDANGNRSETVYPNGQKTVYNYDKLNRLVSEYTVDDKDNVILKYEYTIGKAGEKTSVAENDRTVDYVYDKLYRLVAEAVTDSDGKVTRYSYTYDKVNNRISKTVDGEVTSYTYNELNQLVKENDTLYEYDEAGNLVSVTAPDKSSLFAYNADNKMIRATVQQGNDVSVEEYEYDFAGNRVSKKTENDYVHYLNDISGELSYVIAETDQNGLEVCYYTRGLELLSQFRDGKTSYYLTDGHGSVRALADSDGNITDKYDYDAWGNLISSEGDTPNSYLYCAEALDSTTGLYYLRARYMDPSTGTFTSMDTYQGDIFDPATLHKYLYANSNPVTYNDPTGNFFTLAEFSISSAIDKIMESRTYLKYIEIYNKMRKTLTIINWVCTIYDTARELFLVFTDPNTSGVDVLNAAARGILTGILINGLCKMAYIGPIIKAAVKAGAVYGQVESIIDAAKDGHYDLVVVRIVQLIIDIISLPATCFTGDTLVAVEDGQKRIDEIEVGDKVWAYDIFTGETELKEVLTVYVHDDVTEILHLHTTAGDVDTTTNHPFYVLGRGWVAAGDLKDGDEVFLIDGSTAYITGAELEQLAEPITVYNLEVADFNTYFVGDEAVLVHNYDKHHSDPKYLGGDPDQKLTNIDNADHIEIHKEMDKKYPRWRGKKYYDEQRAKNPKFDDEVYSFLVDLYKKFANKYPDLLKDFENNFKNRKK